MVFKSRDDFVFQIIYCSCEINKKNDIKYMNTVICINIFEN
jgi:hypothetical protein